MGYIRQSWLVIKYAIERWLEWQDAKHWAKAYHPAWVEFATKSARSDVRQTFKQKILEAYRGM